MKRYQALTIAGSDCGGGAGIQADLKTFQELGTYGMSVITAVTAQNTRGVQAVYPMENDAVGAQLDCIGEDLEPSAVKTGMLFSAEIVETVAEKIKQYQWKNLIIDPVMSAKGGSSLLKQAAIQTLINQLIPLALVVTPNIPEAELLTRMPIRTLTDREEASRIIKQMGCQYVVIKGGHDTSGEQLVDLVYDGEQFVYIESKRVHTKHTHGTGCTFSAAIAAKVAQGDTVLEAIKTAKAFIQAAIEDELGIGGGHGPTNHFAYREKDC